MSCAGYEVAPEGLTFASRRITDLQEPRRRSLVDTPPKPKLVPPAAKVVNIRSKRARHTIAPSTPVTGTHSTGPTNTLIESSTLLPPLLLPDTTVSGFGELVADRREDMTSEVQTRGGPPWRLCWSPRGPTWGRRRITADSECTKQRIAAQTNPVSH